MTVRAVAERRPPERSGVKERRAAYRSKERKRNAVSRIMQERGGDQSQMALAHRRPQEQQPGVLLA